jgi:hypothetical protein
LLSLWLLGIIGDRKENKIEMEKGRNDNEFAGKERNVVVGGIATSRGEMSEQIGGYVPLKVLAGRIKTGRAGKIVYWKRVGN